jgi:hypothetical protein
VADTPSSCLPPVIRHDDGRRAAIDCPTSVVWGQDALHDDGSLELSSNRQHIFPAWRCAHPSQEGFGDGHRCSLGTQIRGVLEIEVKPILRHVEQPPWPDRYEPSHLGDGPSVEAQWGGQPVAALALPVARNLCVHRHHEGRESGVTRPGDELFGPLAPAEEVQLEPDRTAGSPDNVVHGVGRHRALGEDRGRCARGRGAGHIAGGVHHPREPNWTHEKRHRDLGAKDGRPQIGRLVLCRSDARLETRGADRFEIGPQRQLLAGPTFEIVLDWHRNATDSAVGTSAAAAGSPRQEAIRLFG